MRQAKELDFFRKLRKLPKEHPSSSLNETSVVHVTTCLLVAMLTLMEIQVFFTPVHRQRFDIDHSYTTVDDSASKQLRVSLNVTVHDFPCIDLSLDYQDIMGTRMVDVRSAVFKQRLRPNGKPVGTSLRNNPKLAMSAAPTSPAIRRNNTGNATCGHCYGALPDDECCNTCSDVLYAYRLKRWSLPRIEEIEQCSHDGSGKSTYQPPQIIHLGDYSSDDYLLSLGTALSRRESHLATPFKRSAGNTAEIDLLGVASRTNNLSWPDCVLRNSVIHGHDIGEALMVDARPYGATVGCWNDNCAQTDQFNCETLDLCAIICRNVTGCVWWTFGSEGASKKCWIRTGKHEREKRYGFSSGSKSCSPPSNVAIGSDTLGMTSEGVSLHNEHDMLGRPLGSSLSPHMPLFGTDAADNDQRQEQKGESCQLYGYFDTNKMPGNFHIGTHGFATPSYSSFRDGALAMQNLRHTINSLYFADVSENSSLVGKEPLDRFASPKAFTFQYYITVSPMTVRKRRGKERHGYQFRAGSYVTNELIGPGVFFRLDVDPIRVTYYKEEKTWTGFVANFCAVVGGCISLSIMLQKIMEAFGHAGLKRD